jgi:hypothetical protein
MEHVLQVVTGSGMMSMLDGFLGYNQVAVAKNDRYKIVSQPHGALMHTYACHSDS